MHCFLIVVLLLNFSEKSLQQNATSPEHVSLLWTGHYLSDRREQRTTVSKLSRDPIRDVENSNFPFVDVVVRHTGVLGAIEGDPKRKRIFVQNLEENYIGVHHLESNLTLEYFSGMVKNLQGMVQDWLTGNLYWTDEARRLIVVVEPTLTYYSILHRLSRGRKPLGIAVHPLRRLLFFSVYGPRQQSIMVCDLACSNPRPLLQAPDVNDVTSLSVDDDKLYWLDFQAPYTNVRSCDLDGSNIRTLLSSGSQFLGGIASFRGVVYVTDANTYYDKNRNGLHKMFMFTSDSNRSVEYSLVEEPNQVTFYKDGYVYSRDDMPSSGECDAPGLDQCDHICLPRLNATRKCACAVGYRLEGETRCVADPLHDDSIIIVDDAQKKIFQLPLSANNSQTHQSFPIASEYERRVVTLALNPRDKTLYWSDRNTSTIYKLPFNSSRPIVVRERVHARSMAVDPVTGNVYFSDESTGYIFVMNGDGKYLKTLVTPDEENSAPIRKMQVDYVNRYLYWIERAQSYFSPGNIKRMALVNNALPEVVVSDIPTGTWSFDINYDNNSLFYDYKHGFASIKLIEVPLSSLAISHGSESTSVREHVLSDVRRSLEIYDFKVVDGRFFFTLQSKAYLSSYNPRSTNPWMKYNNAFFYNPTWLEVYRPSQYRQLSASVSHACTDTICTQLCFSSPEREQLCGCEDNRNESGVNCIATEGDIDYPPDYGNTCPLSSTISLLPCQNETVLHIIPPQWQDDNTAPEDLELTNATIAPSYPPGHYQFLYLARDSAGHLSHCWFSVTVEAATMCPFDFNSRSNDVIATQPSCSSGHLTRTYKCAHQGQMILYDGNYFENLENICNSEGEWSISSIEEVACSIPPTTTTTTTTPFPTTTTTRPSTTTPFHTTTPTTTASTTQPLTTSTSTTVTRSATSNRALTLSTDFADDLLGKPHFLKDAKPQASNESDLSTGSLAAILVISMLILLAIFSGIVVIARRQYLAPLSSNRNGFRLFWNTSAEEAETSHCSETGLNMPA